MDRVAKLAIYNTTSCRTSFSGSTMMISVSLSASLSLVEMISCFFAIPLPAPEVPKIKPDGVLSFPRSMVMILLETWFIP